jgi:hypothetical protein
MICCLNKLSKPEFVKSYHLCVLLRYVRFVQCGEQQQQQQQPHESMMTVTPKKKLFLDDQSTIATIHTSDDDNPYTQTNMTITASSIGSSPWEDASFTLMRDTDNDDENCDEEHHHHRYTGRWSSRSTSSDDGDGIRGSTRRRRDHRFSSSNPTWAQREYNVNAAIVNAERMAHTIRSRLLYGITLLDVLVATFLSIYSMIVTWYHHHNHHSHSTTTNRNNYTTDTSTIYDVNIYSNDVEEKEDDRINHSNYILCTIIVTVLFTWIVLTYLRCINTFVLLQVPVNSSDTRTTDRDDSSPTLRSCVLWTIRICTILLLALYTVCSMSILIGWNLLHLDIIRHFLVFPTATTNTNGIFTDTDPSYPLDDNSTNSTTYNIHTYFLFHPYMIVYLQRSIIPYLYGIFILLCGIEVGRYQFVQSYVNNSIPATTATTAATRSNDHLLRESLLFGPSTDENSHENTAATTTTTTWRTTTLNWWHDRTVKSTAVLDPPQFQSLQDEWTYRNEIEGPYWWSRD